MAGGDLNIAVRVKPHPLFRREGDDLHLEVPVTAWEAALGAEITVPTLEGKASVKVPAGTQSGQTLRLRGKGMPRPDGSGRGDEQIHILVTVPKHLDQKTRELFQELAQHNPENPRAHLTKE
jgi:DnaJ-class molecular chaperone